MSRINRMSSAPTVALFDPANLARPSTGEQRWNTRRRVHPPHPPRHRCRRPGMPPPVKDWEERWILGLYGILYPVEMYLGRTRPEWQAYYNIEADMWVGFRMGDLGRTPSRKFRVRRKPTSAITSPFTSIQFAPPWPVSAAASRLARGGRRFARRGDQRRHIPALGRRRMQGVESGSGFSCQHFERPRTEASLLFLGVCVDRETGDSISTAIRGTWIVTLRIHYSTLTLRRFLDRLCERAEGRLLRHRFGRPGEGKRPTIGAFGGFGSG